MTSPEITEAEAKLDAIRPDLVTEPLRSAVLATAKAATLWRQLATLLTAAEAELGAALADGDVAAAVAAAGHKMIVERLQSQLPSAELPVDVVADALGAAARAVDSAAPGPLPVSSYALELAAYRELPPAWQASVEPPVQLPADAEARAAVKGLAQAREAAIRTIEAWRHNAAPPITTDPLGLLAAAAGTAELAENYAAEQAKVEVIVAEANRARAAAGFTWKPPTEGAVYATSELVIRSN